MKKFIVLLLLLPSLSYAKCLPDTNIVNNNDSLLKAFQRKLDSLQDVVKSISNVATQNTSASYEKSYKNSQIAIELLDILDNTVYSILADRNDALKYTIINQINNPTSNQLGFTFSERITAFSEQVINATNIKEVQKSRLKSTIGNIIEGLKGSFPPLNIVTSVISTFASFNSPYIDKISSTLRRGDSLTVKVQTPVSQRMLKQFSDSIMPFLDFYQNLNNISLQFSNDLKNHKVSYIDYYPSIQSLKNRYYTELQIDISGNTSSYRVVLDNLFEQATQNRNAQFYTRINTKSDVQKLNDFSLQVLSLSKEFKQFYNEYYKILIKNFDDNLLMLNDAKKLSGSDTVQIDKVIEQLKVLRTGTDENQPGFELKFKKNLEKIVSRIIQIFPS
ncbi:hypothetical protein ACFOW1_05775 [Parasediminibacterium paludis]|uniref:Uncharacterized protein n=1 Tax=Parasediminibacterium paludis TaxID=908966 RepID=A0ABV8PWN9_9BACT